MFEATKSLLPPSPDHRPLRGYMVGFEEDDLDELEQLLGAVSVEIGGRWSESGE